MNPFKKINELFKESSDGLKSVESDIPKKKLFGLVHEFSKPDLQQRLDLAREPATQAKNLYEDVKKHYPERLSSEDESLKVLDTHVDLFTTARKIQGKIQGRVPTPTESLLGGAGRLIGPAAGLKRLLGK